MMHPTKKGINLVHWIAYTYFVLKDVFLIVLKLQISPPLQQKWLIFWGQNALKMIAQLIYY